MTDIAIKGIYRDRLFRAGLLERDSGWTHNLIVRRCRVLLAAFLHNDAAAVGLHSLQVGRGDAAWDATPPPAADPNATAALVDPAPFEIPASNLVLEYLDAAEAVVVGPTSTLQVTATLGPGQPTPAGAPPFPLREFGLFGRIGAQLFMIDYIRHPLIEKDGNVTLERKVRLFL
jgi:hypothetical protein